MEKQYITMKSRFRSIYIFFSNIKLALSDDILDYTLAWELNINTINIHIKAFIIIHEVSGIF